MLKIVETKKHDGDVDKDVLALIKLSERLGLLKAVDKLLKHGAPAWCIKLLQDMVQDIE